MRAVAVSGFRAPAELMELPPPVAGPGELLVEMSAAGINPFDWKIAEGIFEGKRPHVMPLVLGVDGSGTVTAIGRGVTRFRVGDRVFGQFLHDPVGTGTYAELAPVPEGIGISLIPSGMGVEEAAALPTAGMTALASLDELSLNPGASLVIVGASGGVGSFATELAAARGIRVLAVARAHSAERLRALGASEILEPEPGAALAKIRDQYPAGVDGLVDVMSDRPGFARWATAVRKGGTAATTTFVADAASLGRAGIRGVNINLQPTGELLGRLAGEVVNHRLPIPLERRVDLGGAATALAELKAGRASGKTVVEIQS